MVGEALDHIAKPPIAEGWSEEWATLMTELAKNANTYVKLSGMVTEASWHNWTPQTLHPYIAHVLEVFSPARSMFGSDWPVCLLAADSYDEIADALETNISGLSGAEQEAVFGQTATAF